MSTAAAATASAVQSHTPLQLPSPPPSQSLSHPQLSSSTCTPLPSAQPPPRNTLYPSSSRPNGFFDHAQQPPLEPRRTGTVSSTSTSNTSNTTTSATSPTGFHFPTLHLGSFDSLSAHLPSESPPPEPTTPSFARLKGSSTSLHRRYASVDSSGHSLSFVPSVNGVRPASSASVNISASSASTGPPVAGSSAQSITDRTPAPVGSASAAAALAHPSAGLDIDDTPTQSRTHTQVAPPESPSTSRGAASTVVSPEPTVGTQSQVVPGSPLARSAGAAPIPSIELGSPPILSPITLDVGPSLARISTPFTFDDDDGTPLDDDENDDADGGDANSTTPQLPNVNSRPLSWAPVHSPISVAGGGPSAIPSLATLGDARAPSPLLTPTSSSFDLSSPRLRESPSVPRRRTIIEPSTHLQRTSPVRVERDSVFLSSNQSIARDESREDEQSAPGSPTPKRNTKPQTSLGTPPTSPSSTRRPVGLSLNTLVSFPEPRPSPSTATCTSTAVDSRLPIDAASPTQKRSLPRPPKPDESVSATVSPSQPLSPGKLSMPTPMPVAVPTAPVLRPPSFAIQTSPKANMTAALGIVTGDPMAVRQSRPQHKQQQFRSTTDPRASVVAPPVDQQPQPQKSNSMPAPYAIRHQPTNSASNLPAIAGLADAGPYPTRQTGGGGLGLPALPALPGALPNGGLQIPPGIKPGEEICLECMMRDRDLADVDVTSDGVWERASDVALEELKSREYDLLRGMSIDHSMSGLSIDESISSSTHGESVSSPRSHASGLATDEAARASAVLKKQQARETRRLKREERDAQVARIGWRGFKWEEGQGGEGFPAGFRGTRPGALTEKGIKNVMTMFPSSSALRFQILQSYLRGQYRLTIEIRQEAQRLGQYPEPEELSYPPSPTLESQDSLGGGVNGRRTARVSMERGAPSIKAPSISTARSAPVTMQQSVPRLRESPSTPAGLNSGIKSRPRTHYDLPPTSAASRLSTATNIRPSPNLSLATSPTNRPTHLKAPSGSTGPKGRESKFYAGDDWSDTEDLWPGYDELGSPASGNLRPFSFAVRAGQQRDREGSIGSHHRRSFFGKFGDSVTSFFTGSHGGSGSMMDMHLGIDMDRRNRTSSYQAHESPRVSAFIQPRPSYSSRQSFVSPERDELMAPPQFVQERPRAKSIANLNPSARLTTVSMYATEGGEDDSPKKKSGIKGLIQKMKKGKRRQSVSAALAAEDLSASDLAPPPPMNFLVNRGERNHDRKRSSSSISMANDSQGSLVAPGSQGGQRSVSAPLGSSGSDVSPTSSRFQPDRPTERPAELPRRSTAPAVELPPGAAQAGYNMRRGSLMGSTMEMLAGTSPNSQPQPSATPELPVVFDEPQSISRDVNGNGAAQPGHLTSHGSRSSTHQGPGQPPQSSLSSRYSTATSAAPVIETPDSINYLSPQQPGETSPNRFKTLPPLPPGMVQSNGGSPNMGSPDMSSDADALSMRYSMYDNNKRMSSASSFPRTSMVEPPITVHRAGIPPNAEYFPTASPRYHQAPLSNPSPGPVPTLSGSPGSATSRSSGSTAFLQPGGGFVPQQRVIQPRASFDVLADNRSARVRRSTAAPGMGLPMDTGRNAQSMYIQQNAAASTGSFGRFLKGDGRSAPPAPQVANMVVQSVPPTDDRKERRRGIKSIFGKK